MSEHHVTVGGSKGAYLCSCGETVANALEHQRQMNADWDWREEEPQPWYDTIAERKGER